MQTQLLIFDLDGTLVDSRADLAAGINHMRSQYGLGTLPLDTISAYVGSGVHDLVERSLRGTEVPFEEALGINRAYYNSHLTVHTTAYPGVCEGIRKLSQAGHQLALLTNKPGDASRAIMQHFGLSEHFTSMIGGGDIEKLKPAPDGIHASLAKTSMSAPQAWMIGDHHTDLVAATNANIRSAFVEYGFGDRLCYEADVNFASFSALVEFFT